MTLDELAAATGSTRANANIILPHLNEAMGRYDIVEPLPKAAFLANVSVETGKLTSYEESLYYKDAQRLANLYSRVFHGDATKAAPYTRNSAKLGQLLYQGYWGRGCIQLTWLANYIKYGKLLGFDYVSNPSLVAEPWHAAHTACAYFVEAGCLSSARQGKFRDVVARINPKLMHFEERQQQYNIATKVFQ